MCRLSSASKLLLLWLHFAGQAAVQSDALLQSNLMLQFATQHKKIPRITYFTCHNPTNHNMTGNDSADSARLGKLQVAYAARQRQLIRRLFEQPSNSQQGPVYARVVYMDVLEHQRHSTVDSAEQLDAFAAWLDDALQVEAQRQIVIVDLACGWLGRQLLQLASAKMMFNDWYHWLLIEDYALHLSFGAALLAPLERFMQDLHCYMNTELILAKRVPHEPRYTLYDVWSPGLNYGGRVNITEIGNFTNAHGLLLHDWFRHSTLLQRRQNMQHARIRTMVVVTKKNMTAPLLDYLTQPIATHIDTMNRFNFNLLMPVRDMFNWTFVLSRTSSWGYMKNGRFDGLMGALIRNETDIGGSPVFYFLERHKHIDAAGRSWASRPCFIFRHPRTTAKDRIVFLQPFSNDVWILLLVFGTLTVLILFLLTTLESQLKPHNGGALIQPKGGAQQLQQQQPALTKSSHLTKLPPIAHFEPVPLTGGIFKRSYLRLNNWINQMKAQSGATKQQGLFLESVLFFVGIICQQGLGFSTSFISGRCIVITSLLFSFCIFQFYSASIVGTLLMEKPKTIRSLRDLVNSPLEAGMEDLLYNRDFFLHTKDPLAMELYYKKISSLPPSKENGAENDEEFEPQDGETKQVYSAIVHSHETGAHAKEHQLSNWFDPDTGLYKVKTQRFAFHVDLAAAYKIIADTFNEREICDLTEVIMFPPQQTVSIMQKHSPLREVISYGLRRVTETGILNYHFNVWHTRKPPCVKKIEASDLQVNMETVHSAVLLLVSSYGIALLVLGIEVIYSKWTYHIVITCK